MSYEIIYKIFTIKRENVYIPFVVCGSNNCYEHNTGKRERCLINANSFFNRVDNNKTEFNSITDLKDNFNTESIDKDLKGGNIQGRFKTAKSIIKSFCKYIIESNIIQLKPQLISLYYAELTNKELTEIKEAFDKLDIQTVLTMTEEGQYKEQLLNSLSETTKEKLKSYWNRNLFCYSYINNEFQIDRELNKFKVKRQPKQQLTDEYANKLLNSDKAYIVNDNTTAEEIKENLKAFNNKRVIVKAGSGLYVGRIDGIRTDGHIRFFKKNKRNMYHLLTKSGCERGALQLNAIVAY